jgi:diguanylate cyclase (GGDEF)-like protein
LLIGRDRSGKWALRAAALWLLLAAAELVWPTAASGSEPHHYVSIFVLTLVLWRVHRGYAVMHELIRHDPLTGLLNRRGFDQAATRELHRAARYARPLAFAVIDIDRFKEVNDGLGHGFGDFVLQTVAADLGCLRGSDLAVRLGGDEFGVLMPETDQAGAELLLSRVQQRVQERTSERGWSVTLSVGVVGLDTLPQAPSVDALVTEADRRMYRAKRAATESHRPERPSVWDPEGRQCSMKCEQ